MLSPASRRLKGNGANPPLIASDFLDNGLGPIDHFSMKITVEISESELKEIRRYAKEKRKGPAIRKLALDALRLRKRQALGERILRGEWSVPIPDVDELRKDRKL